MKCRLLNLLAALSLLPFAAMVTLALAITVKVIAPAFAATTTPSTGPATQPSVSAQAAERMIRPALAQGLHDMTLGKSTLGELVPSLSVEPPKQDAAWDEIVAAADSKFPTDPAKRAVYLVMALKEGDPAEHIDQLKLSPVGGGGSSGAGYIHFASLKLADKPAEGRLDYHVDDRTHQLTGRPRVSADKVPINGALYDLNFDQAMRLGCWMRVIPITGGGEIQVCADCFNGGTHYQVIRVDQHASVRSEDIDGPATEPAVDEPADLATVDNAVLKALLDRDLGEWAKTIEKQPLSNDGPDLLLRLDVLLRAGHSKSAFAVVDALAHAKPPLTQYASSAIADWLIQRQQWNLARHYLEEFPLSESDYIQSLIDEWDQSGGTPAEIDNWLAKRPAANSEYWLHQRLHYRGEKGTADQLLDAMIADVKARPRDVKPALAYLTAVSWAGTQPNVDWMVDTCKPLSAPDSFELGQELSNRSPQATITMLDRSLETPFTAEDDRAMEKMAEGSQQGIPRNLSPEKWLRKMTLENLVRIYESENQPEKAKPLLEKLAAMSPGGLPPPDLGRITGAAEPSSRPSPLDQGIRNAETKEKDSARYWLTRAEYFSGRKELKEAKDAFEKAWTVADVDPEHEFKDPRIFKSSVMRAYARFWRQSHDASSTSELILARLNDIPLDGECARRIVDNLRDREIIDAAPGEKDKGTLIRGDDERLWSFLKAQKVWDHTCEHLLWGMVENAPPAQQEPIWKQAEDLARDTDPSRARIVGWVMTRAHHGEKQLNRRAIPWLKDALARETDHNKREGAAFNLLEAAMAVDDLELAMQIWPTVRAHLTGEEITKWLGNLALAAARLNAPDIAMQQWAAVANLDRCDLHHLDDLAKAGMRDRLIAFYQQMSHDDPVSEVPVEALRNLKAN